MGIKILFEKWLKKIQTEAGSVNAGSD